MCVREPTASSASGRGGLLTFLLSDGHWDVASRRGGLSPVNLRASQI